MRSTQGVRRSIRLKGYDYTQAGAYFITLCSYRRVSLFGEISDEEMHSNEFGRRVEAAWLKTGTIRSNVELDEYVVMPNHFHGILIVSGDAAEGTARRAPTAREFGGSIRSSLGVIVGAFKSATTRSINHIRQTPGLPLWQCNYYEHVIRDDKALDRIRNYILTNPLRWHLDGENPSRTAIDEFDVWLSSFHKGPVRRKSDAELSPKSVRIPNDFSRIT
jgi:putative transposase